VAHRLDDIDRRIVSFLLSDGRMPSSELARRLGPVSERTVRYRIERLIGLVVTADLWIEVVPGHLRRVAESLAALPQVSYVAYSTGERDLSIQVYARDTGDLHHFVSEVVGNIPGVARTSTMLVPEKVKDVHQWDIPELLPIVSGTSESSRARGGRT
jgi:Lrp/AsnC family transcriptional regulator for asnA, asnC and gidA